MAHRILIVANQTLGGEDLAAMLRERLRAGTGGTELWVVVPATRPGGQSAAPAGAAAGAVGGGSWGGASPEGGSRDTDAGARHLARRRLEAARERFAGLGVVVDGEVGDPDPFRAVSDVLAHREFDEVIISTLPAGTSQWLRTDLPRRVHREFKVPVTTVIGRVAQRA